MKCLIRGRVVASSAYFIASKHLKLNMKVNCKLLILSATAFLLVINIISTWKLAPFASKLKQIDLRHNLYSDTTGDCHFRLCFSYFNMGFRNSLLTVDEYIAKLTNYIDENKNLNSIWSFYDPACRVNVIAKLGFGTGSLRKYSNLRGGRYRSFPYQMKIGLRWSDPIPAKKLKQVITYSWFKQNVICSSQPWICNDSG